MVTVMKDKVLVLLAAYNGKQWIEEQVESILKQSNVDVRIVISVDVSTDGTEELVQSMAAKHPNVEFLPMGKKFGGAARNFYRLIMDADIKDDEYIALSDQDDIWKNDKLCRAIANLDKNDFYSSNVTAFWENGMQCEIVKSQPFVDYDYYFEAAGPGCTYVIKKAAYLELRKFIIDNQGPVCNIALHDWFIYAFARSRNYKWHIDNNSGMLYRQHASNQVGANNSLRSIFKRLSLVKNKWYRAEIEKIIELFPLSNDRFLHKNIHSGYVGNLKLMFHVCRLRRRSRDRVLLAMALALNFF